MKQILGKIFIGTLSVAFVAAAFSASPVFAAANATTHNSQNYVVQFNPGAGTKNLQNVAQDIEPAYAFATSAQFTNTYKFQSSESLSELQKDLSGQYQYLEIDQDFHTQSNTTFTPNDPGFSKNPANIDRQWGLLKANFPAAWQKTKGDRKVVVAVIDTGLDSTHEDLRGLHLKTGYNVLTTQTIIGRTNSDDNGHGTLITGVIAADTNNNTGIAGAASGVSIMPVKALDSSGSGKSSEISAAIIWAADHGANVINLSLGGIGFAHDKVLANAISYAYGKNIVIVAAAGNDVAVTGGNLDKDPVFPICDDNGKNMIIGVTATDVNDLKPGFANFGKACVDVSAPGRRILSTINHDPATGADLPDSYAYASGTSLSVPLVAAEAALLKSLFPLATNGQIRDRILATSVNIDNLNLSQCGGQSCKGLLGSGRIDVAKSLEQQIINIADGDVVQVSGTNNFYYINGGKKQVIIPFVRTQRFAFTPVKIVSASELDSFSEGSYAEPLDGTLVKSSNDPSVYLMQNGLRSPLTYQVFLMRGYKFSDVVTLTNIEVGSWVVGSFVTPPDGSLVRSTTNPTVYWVVNGTLHPVNYKFYIDRGLNKSPVLIAPENDISKFPKGDPYIL
ncbi:MAG TPA: S8 family serine peptidase [Patescibacteria group bacterium]|jgi:subtilisin family serine protease|nr:S8 family serine peptidase [Patescibacteria group bacterium]